MDPQLSNHRTPSSEPAIEAPSEFPVLIVGGGPVGLTLSLLLSYHGIRSLLVEQHPGTANYPKARLFKARAMEIYRQLGVEAEVRSRAIPHARNLLIARSLVGEELLRRPIETVLPEFVRDWTPASGMTSRQDAVEPVLLEHARRSQHAQIRFGTQLASFDQRPDHVLARLIHRPTGRVQEVRARYLIGADGRHSAVREALGIPMLGRQVLDYHVNILFRADLSRWALEREVNIAIIANAWAAGLLLYNGEDRWRFTAYYDPSQGQRPEDFTPGYCLQLVRDAIGLQDLPVQLDDISPWHDGALVAERFFDGRVFLAGDSEHVMSPMGGLALNVGIEDAHNLAWKLAAVLKGWARPALLSTYQAERQPVSRRITENSARNAGSMHKTLPAIAQAEPGQVPWIRPEVSREHGLVFGTAYDSSIVVPDGTPPVALTNPITDYVPNARPGSRAPHLWLHRNAEDLSTLDLFGHEFVMLAGSSGAEWTRAAQRVATHRGVPLRAYRLGAGLDFEPSPELWAATYALDDSAAVLVRPDGYVAWRSRSGSRDPGAEMESVLATVTGWSVQRPERVTSPSATAADSAKGL